MSRTTWILIGVLVVGLAGGWYVLRGGDDARTVATDEPATATEREHASTAKRPVLPTNKVARTASGNPVPYWHAEVQAARRSDEPGEQAKAIEPPPARRERPAATEVIRPHPMGGQVTQRELDRSIARAEAKDGQSMSKEKRIELEKQLAARKAKQDDRVQGASQMRDIREQAACTAPDAQQKYAQMSAADKLQFQRRCAKHGFVPAH